ncbi:xyloglucan:xyloglucosyl transferase [Ranunculus cassubicifolius]
MGNLQTWLFALIISLLAFSHSFVDATFSKSMYVTWGSHHISISSGDDQRLVLDQTSGSGIKSKAGFLFGSIEMLIKLVPGDSAGTVTAYYLSSTGSQHDEIDFEFLGNRSGQPYIIHTNIYTQGNGNREQQFYPWFDPSADFHNYTIHWNPSEVVWFVDGRPIRVFRNYENMGVPFPNKQSMRVYSSLWNADNWATRGGLEKINWTSSPFTANLRRFRARACKWIGVSSISSCSSNTTANWWTSPVYSKLSSGQMAQMKSVRDSQMIYDYCRDTRRFNGKMPTECSLQQF